MRKSPKSDETEIVMFGQLIATGWYATTLMIAFLALDFAAGMVIGHFL